MILSRAVKWLFGVPAVLVGLVVLSFFFFEARKSYWDSKVREMCEKDGGVIVYEKVMLTKEEYEKYGGIDGVIQVPGETSSIAHKYLYLANYEEKNINKNPNVYKRVISIYRKSDKKVLGKMTIYHRSGGDFPTIISHPSGFGCKDLPNFELDVVRKIFGVEGE